MLFERVEHLSAIYLPYQWLPRGQPDKSLVCGIPIFLIETELVGFDGEPFKYQNNLLNHNTKTYFGGSDSK